MSASPAPPRNMPITGLDPPRRRRHSAISSRATICGARSVWASSSNRSSASTGSPPAPRSSAMRLVLPFGSTATGGGVSPKWPPLIELGQRRLDGAVAAVDDEHLGLDPRDGLAAPRRSGRHARPHNGRCRDARRRSARMRGSWARLPVDLGLERSAIRGGPSAGRPARPKGRDDSAARRRPARGAAPTSTAVLRNGGRKIGDRQRADCSKSRRHRWRSRLAVAVEIVADRDRIAARAGHGDADVDRRRCRSPAPRPGAAYGRFSRKSPGRRHRARRWTMPVRALEAADARPAPRACPRRTAAASAPTTPRAGAAGRPAPPRQRTAIGRTQDFNMISLSGSL